MKPSRSKPVLLDVVAPDRATEIFVMNGEMQRIAKGVGRLEVTVSPGVYKARFRSGASQYDKLVVVTGDQDPVEVLGPTIEFRSAVPISATATTHEYHSGPAGELSKQIHEIRGAGSGLFVFLREEDLESTEFRPETVSLHDLDGSRIFTLGDSPRDDRWMYAGCSTEVDPGTYRLRVDTESLGRYEIFVTTCADWQTQVFLVTEDFWKDQARFRRPSLRQSAVLMARPGLGFDPDREDARLAELARLGLLQGRSVVPEEDLATMIHEKFGDPMLGVYGAHLMLLKRPLNRQLFAIVVDNLELLLGRHPDVRALQLRQMEVNAQRVESEVSFASHEPFDAPPMLRRSWDLIVAASRRRAGLVPRGSVSAEISDNLAAGDPWLMHRVPDEEVVFVEDAEHISLNRAAMLMERILSTDPAMLDELKKTAWESESKFSRLELMILSAISLPVGESTRALFSSKGKRRSARAILNNLDAPSYALADSVQSLARKLGID